MTVSHDWRLYQIRRSGGSPEQQLAASQIVAARESCAAGNRDDCTWLRSCGLAYLAVVCPHDISGSEVLERILVDLPAPGQEEGWREKAEHFIQLLLSIPP